MLLISLLVTTANGLTNVTDNYDHEIMIQTQALRAFARRRIATYGRRRLATRDRRRLEDDDDSSWLWSWSGSMPSADFPEAWKNREGFKKPDNFETARGDKDVQAEMKADGVDMSDKEQQEEWYKDEYMDYFNEDIKNEPIDGVPSWEPYYVWCIAIAIVIMVWLAPRLYKGFKIEGCMGLVVFALGAGAITSGAMCLGFANEAGYVSADFFNAGGIIGNTDMFPDSYCTVMYVDMEWTEGKPDFWGSEGSSTFASRAGMCAHVGIALAILCALVGVCTHFMNKPKDSDGR